MSDIICVTNRKLCKGNFIERVETIAQTRPKAIILREKDLSEKEYRDLAEKVTEICKKYDILCILHSFTETAVDLKADGLHVPLPRLREINERQKMCFDYIGTSCHSLEEAKEAERLGCTYLIAGHIFTTGCKKGVPPRGLGFLEKICGRVTIPVYAIGGISHKNLASVKEAGALGGCVMSGLMECENVRKYMEAFDDE